MSEQVEQMVELLKQRLGVSVHPLPSGQAIAVNGRLLLRWDASFDKWQVCALIPLESGKRAEIELGYVYHWALPNYLLGVAYAGSSIGIDTSGEEKRYVERER
jgi:hypothetical protein